MSLEQLAGARNQTPFEFLEECYRRKWGVPPLKRTLEDDFLRYMTRGSIPRYVSDLFPPDFVLPAYAIPR